MNPEDRPHLRRESNPPAGEAREAGSPVSPVEHDPRIQPGALVEWDHLQLDGPLHVTGVSPDGLYAFVAESNTGLPIGELRVVPSRRDAILEELAELERLYEGFQGKIASSRHVRQRMVARMTALQEELRVIEGVPEVVPPTQESGEHIHETEAADTARDGVTDGPEAPESYDRAQTMIDHVSQRHTPSYDRAQQMIDHLNGRYDPVPEQDESAPDASQAGSLSTDPAETPIEPESEIPEPPRVELTDVTAETIETPSPDASEVHPEIPVSPGVAVPEESEKTSDVSPDHAEAQITAESERTPSNLDPWTEQYLSAQFNLTGEDLASIEGFERLTGPQQRFVCENLAQLTLGNVQEEAERLVSKSVGMRRSEMIKDHGRILGGALAGIREILTGGHVKLKTEQEVADRVRTGGLEEHGALLKELVQNMAEKGPRVHDNGRGGFIIDLLNIRERARDKSTRDAEWFAMNELNAAAHELANTPSEWRGQTLGVEVGGQWGVTKLFKERVFRTKGAVQESTYAKREEAYERTKRNLEDILRQKGDSDLRIAETLVGLDARVHQLQTLKTNPNAIEELAAIKDKDLFTESAKHFLAGPGVYMALGSIGRTLGGAALGFVGAPIAAGVLDSVRSWNRTAAELRERDRNARAGVRDAGPGALNVVHAERAEQVILVNGQEMHNGLTAKLERLLHHVQHMEGADKKRLLAQLQTRVEYVHDKLRLHRIDYGGPSGRVSRQVALTEALARSLAYLSEEALTQEAAVKQHAERASGRLSRRLSRTEQMIIAARLKGRRSDLVRSASIAASFSVVGALLADLFSGTDSAPRAAGGGTAAGTLMAESVAPATVESVASSVPPYTVQQGDTLWDILSQKTSLSELGETRARENAVANIVKSLTAAELQEIGVTSGDARLIHPGDTIDMEKLGTLLADRSGIIESAEARYGHLPIDTDPADIIPRQVNG